jgi:CDP-diacylglycerol--glycerol-3-phosphate 3-phosphatidyltransferase
MISRDMIVDAIRLVAVGQGKVIAASKLGKLKTVTQMVALIAILAFPQFVFMGYLAYVAALVSLISGVDYFMKNRKIILSDLRG